MKVAAIVPAAGQGKRLKGKTPKPLVRIFGKPLFIHTLVSLKRSLRFHEIILVADPSQVKSMKRSLWRYGLENIRVVAGGKTRAASVRNAVLKVSLGCDFVLIHDMARPLVGEALVRKLLSAARKTGAALCAVPATATVKKIDAKRSCVVRTLDRRLLYLAQTPQVFRKSLILRRYEVLGKKALQATDEAALFDGSKTVVKLVPGDPKNIKITTKDDIELFKFYLTRHCERSETI